VLRARDAEALSCNAPMFEDVDRRRRDLVRPGRLTAGLDGCRGKPTPSALFGRTLVVRVAAVGRTASPTPPSPKGR